MNMKNQLKHDIHRDPAELEREADAARDELEHTLEALEARISPARNMDRITHAILDNTSDFGRRLSEQVTANPVPTIVTGIGLAWLMGATRHAQAPGNYSAGTHRTGEAYDKAKHAASATAAGMRSAADSARSAAHGIADSTRSVSHSAADATGTAARSIGSAAASSAQSIGHAARRVGDGYAYLRSEQPLALGAAAVAAGALIAAFLPPTRVEDRVAGDASDRSRQRLDENASHMIDKAEARLEKTARSVSNSESSPAAAGSRTRNSSDGTRTAPDYRGT